MLWPNHRLTFNVYIVYIPFYMQYPPISPNSKCMYKLTLYHCHACLTFNFCAVNKVLVKYKPVCIVLVLADKYFETSLPRLSFHTINPHHDSSKIFLSDNILNYTSNEHTIQ